MPDSARDRSTNEPDHVWPAEGLSVIPDWVYTSRAIYDREVARIDQQRPRLRRLVEAPRRRPIWRRRLHGPAQ